MKFLIAGLGSIGRRHLRNLLALGERDILLLRTFQSTLPDEELAEFPVETDLEAALAQRPDAVIVSNPTAHHLEVAIPSATAGCHLLLEKPVSHSVQGLDELQAVVRRSGVQVLVGYQFRFHPGLQKAKQLLVEGAIGRPLSVHAHWGEYLPDWHPWEDYRDGYSARADLGGGVALTLSHPIDYLRWFFGEIQELWAFTASRSDWHLDVEDTAVVGLHFENGILGSLHLDYNQRPPAHRLEVIGTHGTMRWDSSDGAVTVCRAQESKNQPNTQAEWQTYPITTGQVYERNQMFLAEMSHFLEIVRGTATPICTLEDGIQANRLALGILESAYYGFIYEPLTGTE
jgi:predicted dehydrogenase